MKKLAGFIAVWGFLVVSLVFCNFAHADVEIQKLPNAFDKFLVGMEVMTFYRADSNPYFGARFGVKNDEDSHFGEVFGRLTLTAIKDVGWATLEAKLAPVFLTTVGQDVYGLYKDETDIDLNKAYLKFGHLFKNPVDVTIGMQDIQIEKQFLIGIGRGQKAAAWSLFHQSWPFGVKVDCDFGRIKTTAFWARTDNYLFQTFEGKDDVEATGINLHFDVTDKFFVYGGFYAKLDDATPGSLGTFGQPTSQNDTYAWDFGFDFNLGGFHLEGEGVLERGDVKTAPGANTLDRRAFGGYASGKYTFPVHLSPYVQVDYIYYQGDNNLGNSTVKEYDPMFWGFPSWNRWVIGELVGETQLPNSNKRDLVLEVGCSPVETMVLHAMYINHRLDEKYFAAMITGFGSAPVSSRKWADEFDIYMDWQVHDYLFVHAGVGYVNPNKAAKEVYGNNDAFFGQLWLMFAF